MFSPEFGGMTANVEFEALTGFSNAFLPYGSIPYQQYVRGPVPSLANFFRSEGYETTAIHPFEGWFWNREHVYDAFGFDRFLSIEKLPPMASRGPLVSDDALTDEIIKRADATERPFFTFAVSLQGHGPYEPNRYRDARVKVESVAGLLGTAGADDPLVRRRGRRRHAGDLKRLIDSACTATGTLLIVFFSNRPHARTHHSSKYGFLKEPLRPREPEALARRRDAAGGVVEQKRRDEGCRGDQPVADSAEAFPGGRHERAAPAFVGRVDTADIHPAACMISLPARRRLVAEESLSRPDW